MAVTASSQREWAKRGAGARLLEIEQERAAILAAFPELRRGGAAAAQTPSAASANPRRKISAAARRAMSAGMRKYWARRKSQAKAPGKSA